VSEERFEKEIRAHLRRGFDMGLGEYRDMLVQEDWAAIRYSVCIVDKKAGERIEQETAEIVVSRTIRTRSGRGS
jgi:hypothetical protein